MKSTSMKQFPDRFEKAIIKSTLPTDLQLINDWINGQKAKFASPTGRDKLGHVALMYGSKNTSNLTIATLLANKAGKELYHVDLSKLISKYIGETEKNLNHLFELAETKEWILFFDEADAIFGNRSQVKDAHDRYANLEVPYLLGKIEGFNGQVVLSTNRRSGIDPVFLRGLKHQISTDKLFKIP